MKVAKLRRTHLVRERMRKLDRGRSSPHFALPPCDVCEHPQKNGSVKVGNPVLEEKRAFRAPVDWNRSRRKSDATEFESASERGMVVSKNKKEARRDRQRQGWSRYPQTVVLLLIKQALMKSTAVQCRQTME